MINDTISSLMTDTETFRQKVIDAGIRGKLTKQLPEDGNADTIIPVISDERTELLRNGKTKFSSKLIKKVKEKPYEVPDNWEWVSLGEICILLTRGKSPKYSNEDKYPVFAQKCNQPDGLALYKAKFLDESTLSKWPEYFRLQNADIVINSTGTGTMGRVGYYTDDSLNAKYPFMLPDSHITIARTGRGIVPRYVYYALKSTSIYQIMESTFRGSTNQKEFYIDSAYSMPIPLPPTAEQERIVDRIDEILDMQRHLAASLKEYSSNAEVLKTKVIDAGIQGKLTEQLPEDGDAKDLYQQIQAEEEKLVKDGKIKKSKPLPPINPEEIAFEIPKNWKWVRLGDIFDHNSGKALNSSNKNGSLLTYITTSNVYWDHFELNNLKSMYFNDSEIEKCTIQKGDLLICEGGDIGRAAIWPYKQKIRIQNHLHRLRPFLPQVIVKYYYYMMWSYKLNGLINGRGIGLQGFSSRRVHSLIVPLPPATEQERIVNRIDEILAEI